MLIKPGLSVRLKIYSPFLLLIIFSSGCKSSGGDVSTLQFTEHPEVFLKSIPYEKEKKYKNGSGYEVTDLKKCNFTGVSLDKLTIGANDDRITYYKAETKTTANTAALLKAVVAKYKQPTKKLRDDDDVKAYYWITPTVFVRFLSGVIYQNKQVSAMFQVGDIKFIKSGVDDELSELYHSVATWDDPAAIAKRQSAVTNGAPVNKQVLTHHKPYYAVSFSGDGCRFVIYVNDVPAFTFNEGGSVTTEVPINQLILQSGVQNVRYVMLPAKGQTALNYASSLQVKIVKSDGDDADQQTENVAKFKTLTAPKGGLTQVQNQEQFKAEVPYKLEGWQHAVDLKNSTSTKAELTAAYQKIVTLLNAKDYAALKKGFAPKLAEVNKAIYSNDAETEDEWKEMIDYISKPGMRAQFNASQAQVQCYADGKLVTFLQPDQQTALRIYNSKTNDEYQLPLIFYKPNAGAPLTLIR